MSLLFEPLQIRGVQFRNRAWMSPMCQYSGEDGFPTDWHLVHLGSRAQGGAGMVMTEATAVTPEGRISPADLGIWSDDHVEAYQRLTRFASDQGAVPAIQLAHAGRKAGTNLPWLGGKPLDPDEGGWEPLAPSPIAFNEGYTTPRELSIEEVSHVVGAFGEATRRARDAGFKVIELHAAHGYLLHEFLSPITNQRDDRYGGDFEGRVRLAVETAATVRQEAGDHLAVFVRVSADEYVEGGWDLEQTIELSRRLKDVGVDLIDASSGGNLPHQQLHPYPGYQTGFARAIRQQAGIATAAVGLITEPSHAESVLQARDADAILLGRVLLRDPYWPLHAAWELGDEVEWRPQYVRGRV
ncbi:MAG: NADH:flavin oxidoreductase/NADH oxidase [Chloroflexi bacterium]|nr:NADH:flavin oxidoreductase/NADH oxidase [Chloroflexota bacterium]